MGSLAFSMCKALRYPAPVQVIMKFLQLLFVHVFVLNKVSVLLKFLVAAMIKEDGLCHGLLKNFYAPAEDRTGDPLI